MERLAFSPDPVDLLSPPPPFVRRHQFLARFASSGGHTDPVQVAVDYSLVAPGEITGVILGGHDAQRAIAHASHNPDLSFVSDPSVPRRPPGYGVRIWSDSAVLGTMTMIDGATEGLVRRVAGLDCFNLTIEETRADMDHKRVAAFYLYGPTSVWTLKPDVDALFNGRSEYVNTDLEISDGTLRLSIDVETQQEQDHGDRGLSIRRSLHVLYVETDATPDELSDDAFAESARQLVDDVLLLTSLAAKTWVGWFRSTLHSGRRTVDHVRRLAHEPETRFRHDDQMAVPMDSLRDFLRTAVPLYREAHNDLRIAILTHVGAKDLRYAEAQFLSRFTVLESLRARFARREGFEEVLGKGPARRVRHAVRDALASLDLPNEAAETIERKVPELNRYPFTDVLERLLAHHEVGLDDLYPEGVTPTLVRTRNRLVHGDIEFTDGNEFFRETVRLEALLDRLFLRLLGWDDLSYAPSGHNHDWIRRSQT